MNSNNLSSVQLTKISDNPNALKNGDTVFVRVLAKESTGNYIVTFAGSKLHVSSERQLEVGSAFKALVTITDGKVLLTPHSESYNPRQTFSLQHTDMLPQLKIYLQNLGLPLDSISLKIVQYFQSFGMSFNYTIAQKARAIGLKFPGKEDEATEIALFLEQKGIAADIETVLELLGVFYGSPTGNNLQHNSNSESLDKNKIDSEESLINRIYDNVQDILTRECGLLALLNHHYVNPLHWIILPFETLDEEKNITGSIRLLLDIDKKTTEKIIIFSNFTRNKSNVVLYCNKGTILDKTGYSIQFCCNGQDGFQNEKKLVELFRSVLPKNILFDISYNSELLSNSVFTSNSSISFVQVDA